MTIDFETLSTFSFKMCPYKSNSLIFGVLTQHKVCQRLEEPQKMLKAKVVLCSKILAQLSGNTGELKFL